MLRRRFLLVVVLASSASGAVVRGHEGPDPRANWLFEQAFIKDGRLAAQVGPALRPEGQAAAESAGRLRCLRLDGREDLFVAEGAWGDVRAVLPDEAFTVSALVSLDDTLPFGGIVSAFQDNGDAETGWVLGYNDRHFTFGLSTAGADDGDGRMTYLSGTTPLERSRWYHVCGVYDGESMQLWVNGRLDAESRDQHGLVRYPKDAQLVLGAYADANESFPMHGRLGQVVIYDVAAKPAWVAHEYEHHAAWVALPPEPDPAKNFSFLVKPYLQYATGTSIRVMCEVSRPAKVRVRFGETSRFDREAEATSDDGLLHAAVLDGLAPETGHYYQVTVQEEGRDTWLEGDVGSFQTASRPETPFAFAVMGDTQGNPKVNGSLAEQIWRLRPNFLLIPGDLVDQGPIKRQWVDEFFASMSPLFSRVCFYPVIGNHEQNADHYYRYMNVPAPEYHYAFQYGNAKFFAIDSNKNVGPDSEQYRWLERELAALEAAEKNGTSDVVWKFVSYHHPSYSSDEDDYGNLWKGKSTYGDMRIRPLTKLFDRYGVDVVWNGHIHSYERTWPIRAGRPVEQDGTIYVIAGGGGGGLEQAGPIRPPFQNNVRRSHHFVFAAVNGRTLELKSFDLDGRLFDTVTIRKPAGSAPAAPAAVRVGQ
jgi:hypothetical protein